MDEISRHWFRCAIPDGPEQTRRVALLKDWAEFLAQSADVHFSHEVADGQISCDLVYVGEEDARLFTTKLYLATGESFELLRTVQVEDAEHKVPSAREQTAALPEVTAHVETARVSLMITRAQRAELQRRGYPADAIRNMTPSEAHKILGLAGRAES